MEEEDVKLRNHLYKQSIFNSIPQSHIDYLQKLKESGFEPKVIYDIGSCVLHWTKEAKKIWPKARIICFDASTTVDFLYKDVEYHIGVLSNEDDKEVKFYQNDYHQGGNSYYKEIGSFLSPSLFNEHTSSFRKTEKLSSVVKKRNFPLPDLIKMDVQGSEQDIIKGSEDIIKNSKYFIVEMQKVQYNESAPLVTETLPYIESLGFKCVAPLFSDNGPDGDYCFQNKN